MKPSKLYLEIFISFVLAIMVSETMIFFLFTDSEKRIVVYKMEQNTLIKVLMLKKLIDKEIESTPPNKDPWTEEQMRDLLASVESIYDAAIWIANAAGAPLIPPGGGSIPPDIRQLDTIRRTKQEGIKLHYQRISNTFANVYASVPLSPFQGDIPTLFIVFNVKVPPTHRWQFSMGLLVIGIVVALLTIPLSKFITDRIKTLKISALRIAEGELSHRVTVKTRDEIGELGIAFNQMADRLERMIVGGKELTANISHELRTPLTRMRIAQELISERLEKRDFSKCEGRLNQIREDIEELDALIGSILELSKLDIHEAALKYEPFNPVKLFDELLEKLRPVIAHKNLSVQKKLPESPLITGDRTALTTAISNILDNAAKFCPEAGVIRIHMSPDTSFFNIRITNTYETVLEADLEKIFEPFYRSPKTKASGSGLGLSIAAKIIRKHGGRISASNTRDGFEIFVEVPIGNRTEVRE